MTVCKDILMNFTDFKSHIDEISAYKSAYIVGCTFSIELPEELLD